MSEVRRSRAVDRDRYNSPSRPRSGAKRTVLSSIRNLPSYLKLLVGLMSDSTVSRLDRLLVVAAIAYIVSPIDLIPDVIPFLGQVDDVYLLVLAIQRLIKRAGRRTILRYWGGDPGALSDSSLASVVGAAAFFLPGRTRRSLHRIVGRR